MASSFADALDLGAPPPASSAACPDPPGSGLLLDLGCGWGPIALALADAAPGATVLAADVNERAIDLAARNAAAAGHTNIHAAEATALAAELEGSGAYVDLEGYSVGGGAGRRARGAGREARGRRQVHGGALLLRSLKCGWTTWKVIPRASVSSGSRRGGRRPHGSRRSCRSRGGTALARHHADPDPRATASGREGPKDDGGWPMRTSARPSFSWVNPRSHGPGAARWRPLRSTARTIRRRRERGPSQLPPLPHRPRITRTHTHPE